MVWFLGQAPLALLKAPPNHRANINRKSAAHLNPDVFRAANRFHLRGKTIKDGPKACSSLSVMAGLVPAIHVCLPRCKGKTWMPGTRPGMTSRPEAPDFTRCI